MPICNGSYSSISSLNKHVRKIHETGKTFPCRKCGKPFLNLLQMRQHKMEAHPELVYKRICPVCNEEFSYRESFIKHQHTDIKTEQEIDKSNFETPMGCYEGCFLCGEEQQDKKAFAKHQQIHLLMTDEELEECTRAKKFSCKVCGKTFNFKKNLFRHMDVHLEKNL
ncbi:hypothetical protein NQ314_013632 [Rhamnusium bicolor]|uniref:C2H2-type domain-containing protein n=1 Tax=Rhamnusium bicolor TaxID=1586634 RepID=A0AAV8X628_9CUCU|nr:hypothetical protein NQ314_013632 [Rhamnusium bicolor]